MPPIDTARWYDAPPPGALGRFAFWQVSTAERVRSQVMGVALRWRNGPLAKGAEQGALPVGQGVQAFGQQLASDTAGHVQSHGFDAVIGRC